MKDLAPKILRQRLLIEGLYTADIDPDTDCNGILWERFAAHHQTTEINEIWPDAHYSSERSPHEHP